MPVADELNRQCLLSCKSFHRSALPEVVVRRADIDAHRDEAHQALVEHTTEEVQVEDGVVLPFGTVRVLEDVQRVPPVPRPPARLRDRVLRVRVHLVDHLARDVVFEKELAGVRKSASEEGVVGQDGPVGEDAC